MTYKLMPAAALVDIDGTLVDVSSVRHHVAGPGKRNFDAFHRESADCPPIAMTLSWVEEMHDAGHHILVVIARMEKWREITEFVLCAVAVRGGSMFWTTVAIRRRTDI